MMFWPSQPVIEHHDSRHDDDLVLLLKVWRRYNVDASRLAVVGSIQGTLFCALKLALNSTTHRPDLQICSSSTAPAKRAEQMMQIGLLLASLFIFLDYLFSPRFS